MPLQDELIDNLLDNLDDLYDRACTPRDTRALVLASAVALSGTSWEPLLTRTVEALAVRKASEAEQYEHALLVTDELRQAVAGDWERRAGEVAGQSRMLLAQADIAGLPVDVARVRVQALGLVFRVSGEPEQYVSWNPRRVTVQVERGVVRQADIG